VNSATTRSGLFVTIALLFTAMLVIMAPRAQAQTPGEGADIYSDQCARCHKDDGLGEPNKYPPLTGNPDAADQDYVVVVVTDGLEGKVILGVPYDRKMPAFKDRLSPEQIQLVSEYVTELSVSGAPTTPTTPDGDGDEVVVGADAAAVGNNLFRGTTLLSNGGVACIACHAAGDYNRLGGPGLAIDLNGIIDDYGVGGFVDAITDPVEPAMIAVFLDHPITEKEALSLAAFLEPTSAESADGSSIDMMSVLALVGFLVLILITGLIIRGPQRAYVTKLRSSR
jgi:mono/diheme cytochrome c family protein